MLFNQIASNKRRTWYVLIGFFLLVLLVGAAIGRLALGNLLIGVVVAAGLAIIYILIMINQSIDVVMQMNHGQEITNKEQAPVLWDVVSDMALVAKIPMPRVFIVDDEGPNAFATGMDPKHSAVAVTTGLLHLMNREELEGVIGHEVSHIRNYDIRVSTIGVALASVISILVDFGTNLMFWGGGSRDDDDDNNNGGILTLIMSIFVIILGPLAATIAQMALSRNREYLADASSVELTRNPLGLIHALKKLEDDPEPTKSASATSSGLYISDPYPSTAEHHFSFASLFDTHPSIASRIQRLQHM